MKLCDDAIHCDCSYKLEKALEENKLLLKSLENLDSYFSMVGEDDWVRFFKEVLEPARAAISKAKGE